MLTLVSMLVSSTKSQKKNYRQILNVCMSDNALTVLPNHSQTVGDTIRHRHQMISIKLIKFIIFQLRHQNRSMLIKMFHVNHFEEHRVFDTGR